MFARFILASGFLANIGLPSLSPMTGSPEKRLKATEKLSLVNRFGVTISYSKPSQKEFFNIVTELARKSGCTLSDEELCREANKWELSHGGISGRTATQFVNYIMANN